MQEQKNTTPKEIYRKLNASKLINKNFSRRNIGSCVDGLAQYLKKTDKPEFKDFKKFYVKLRGFDLLKKAYENYLEDCKFEKIYEYYNQKEVSVLRDYFSFRVFGQTWNGVAMEYKFKSILENNGYKTRFSTDSEDVNYAVDIITDDFAVQVKPLSYKNGWNPSLNRDKKLHQLAHEKYSKKTGNKVYFAFYDKKLIFESEIIKTIKNEN